MQGFLHFLWENFCPESFYSSPKHFLLKETLHEVNSTEKKITQDNCHVPHFEHYLNTVDTEIEDE